jgi:hypothetical protein
MRVLESWGEMKNGFGEDLENEYSATDWRHLSLF